MALLGSGDAAMEAEFRAAHDGFTLPDTVAYAGRHNHANSEDNRDGHGDNYSWNFGVEGASSDAAKLIWRPCSGPCSPQPARSC